MELLEDEGESVRYFRDEFVFLSGQHNSSVPMARATCPSKVGCCAV